MNHLLLLPEELDGSSSGQGGAIVRGERAEHIRKILKLAPGDLLKVGVLNGGRGTGRLQRVERGEVALEFSLDEPAPTRLALHLVVALPRPKFVGRILQMAACFGVERLAFLQTERVEKSYWSSSVLEPESVARHFHLGLEQGRDTIAPQFEMAHRFDLFLRETLAWRLSKYPGWAMHGGAETPAPAYGELPATLLIGPEGGFVDREVETLREISVAAYRLGERPMRVEVAIAAALSRFL